jgi:hypothetical protein
MITYFNKRTGDTAVFAEPNQRLEALDNWVRVNEGDPTPAVESDGVLSRPHLSTTTPVRVQNPPDGGDPILQDGRRGPASTPSPAAPEPLHTTEGDNPTGGETVPAEDAPLEEWRAYATKIAGSAEAQADVAGMTRDELIAAYGGAPREKTDDPEVEPPASSAPVAEWRAWVIAHRVDNDPAVHAEIEKASKADLIKQYGSGS